MLKGDKWQPIPLCKGLIADSALFDPTGEIWSRAGHWPLFLTIGTARARAPDAVARRDVKFHKSEYCRKNGHWPWWIEHPSECAYWKEDSEYDGEIWWNARQQYTEEEAIEYDKRWIKLYGRPAYFEAVAKVAGDDEAAKLQLKIPEDLEAPFALAGSSSTCIAKRPQESPADEPQKRPKT